MHIISIINHKGGVGKTTTVTNLAMTLSKKGKNNVLVVDCDPQGNASQTLGKVPQYEQPRTIEDLFTEKGMTFTNCAVESKYPGVDLIPNNLDASTMAVNLDMNDPIRFMGLRAKLDADPKARELYKFILIDCPPQIDSMFLVNALIVSQYFIIPIESESSYALSGVDALLRAVDKISGSINPNLRLLGALITMFDSRTKAGRLISDSVVAYFGLENVFRTKVHRNTAISRANIANRCICDYDPRALGCKNYRDLAKEVEQRIKKLEAGE